LEGLKLGLLIELFYVAANFRYNHFNTQGDFILILFLKSHNQLIPPAKYDGTVLKTPMVNLGKAIKLSFMG
jgi:hypothetical protein